MAPTPEQILQDDSIPEIKVKCFAAGELREIKGKVLRTVYGRKAGVESTIQAGRSAALKSKGIDFGILARNADGTWDTSAVVGLAPQALGSSDPGNPPSLILQPWHQVGNVVSVRQFTNNAYNHHHGMQAEERFGAGVDQDGDGLANELTRADITAATLFQAAMAVPGRVIPDDPTVQAAILNGELLFSKIGCSTCHVPSLPLRNWMYTEPNPYNPSGCRSISALTTIRCIGSTSGRQTFELSETGRCSHVHHGPDRPPLASSPPHTAQQGH